MTATCPKLRPDLEFRCQTTNAGQATIIKDPDSGQFFRLREAEQFIARQLDGTTSLEVLHNRIKDKFGAAIAPNALTAFINTLDQNGLLENEAGQCARKRKPQSRITGNLLSLRFRLFDPNRLLAILLRHTRFFFTPQFVFLSSILILSAIVVTGSHWNEIIRDASRLYHVSTLPLLIVTVFLVMTAHEFAHGLTCKHFGGEVREMGFLLLFFQPAFYCNVSDAWLFPEKSKRLWVGFAGPFFELLLWALATLAWRLTDTETWVSYISLVVMATSGIKTLLNFNPLLKLDGYYLLSDYLDIPNLRQKSFRYLGDFLKHLGGLTGPLPKASRRERRIYLGYGLTAWVFSLTILISMTLTIGERLIVHNQSAAFIAFTGLMGFRFRGGFSQLFSRKSGNGEHSGQLKRKSAFFNPRRLLKFAIVAAVLSFLFWGRMELRVTAPIDILPLHNADVRAQTEGLLEEIYVDEGDHVNKGDLIARLSDREHRAELQKTAAALQQMQAKLEMLRTGPTKQQVDVARRAVATAEDRLMFAQARMAREKPLFDQQLLAASDFDAVRQLESTSKNELAEAQSKLQLLLDGTRPEEIRAAEAEVSRLEAQQRYWNEQLQLVTVFSPAAGVVTTPSRELKEMARQMVQKGELIAKVHEINTVTVEAAISEKEIADVKVGQTVAVKLRAHPERVFFGKVTAIAMTVHGAASTPKATASASPQLGVVRPPNAVIVRTEIDNRANLLKPGMTGLAKIYCGERRVLDLLERRLSRTLRVEFWSWW
jgi:putative peptide zinc metalloprotease protein